METLSLTNLVDRQGEILVDFTVDPENGTVVARASLCGVPESNTTGYAFTHPDDKFDERVGLELAAGRAVQELGTKLIRRGNKVVNKKDKFRRDQKKASERAVAERKVKSAEVKAKIAVSAGEEVYDVGDRVQVVSRTLDKGGLFGLQGTVVPSVYTYSTYVWVKLDNPPSTSAKPCPLLRSEIKKISTSIREDLPA